MDQIDTVLQVNGLYMHFTLIYTVPGYCGADLLGGRVDVADRHPLDEELIEAEEGGAQARQTWTEQRRPPSLHQ